jgi:hypothetical protein
LESQQVIAGLGRLAGGGDERLAVALQDLDPAGKILGMIGARLSRNAQASAEERCTQFGNQLFGGIGIIAKALAKLALEPWSALLSGRNPMIGRDAAGEGRASAGIE